MNGSRRPPLNELVSLQQAIVAREGVTTFAGGAGGISIVDAGLIGFGADSFRSMTLQIYPGDPTRVDTADITGFDNGSGEVSVSGGMKGGVVPAGVPYKILTLRPAIAEVHGVFTVLPSAPEIIKQDTIQDLSLSISTVEGIPVAANLTAGTITITRFRVGVGETVIVNGLACTAANGRIYYAYTFPSAGAAWQPGDEYKAVFSGQQVAVGATTYALSDIRCKGIIIDVVAAVGAIAAVEGKLDLPAVDDPLNTRIAEMVGRKDDTIPAMNLAPGATDSLVRHLKAILERLGATPADPDDSLLTNVGQRDDAATADTLADVTTTSIEAKLRLILNRMAPNAFAATVNSNADTALDDMIAHLAAYFNAVGAALSVVSQPGVAARTTLNAILTDLADILAGDTGIVTFPAAAVPGNGVSIAEVLRQIYNDVIALAGAGVLHEQADVPFNVNAALAEANIFDLSVANTRYVVRGLRLKCVDPGAETVTVRLYELVNNAPTLVDTFAITTANFATAHSLADMFGLFQLAGDNLKVAVIATAAGPYACTGQYCTATATI